MVKIVALSDTHGTNVRTKLEIPPCDIVIHAGDGTPRGAADTLAQLARQLRDTDARFVVYVPGNHDKLFYYNREEAMAIFRKEKIIVLIDEVVELMGLRIYGFPWLPNRSGTCSHAWETDDMVEKVRDIPTFVDILVSHGPPYGILDKAIKDWIRMGPGEPKQPLSYHNLGNTAMTNTLTYGHLHPRYFICGHIHEARGITEFGGTTFVNAAICDEDNHPVNQPYVLEI